MAKATTGSSKVRTTKRRPADSDAPRDEPISPRVSATPPPPPEPEDDRFGEGLAEEEPTGPIDAETHAKYEEIKRGEIHITELQKMS
ncbi:MAG: hypothetical protein AABZ12_08255, partial [Planctomycetota bacterium]